MTGQTDADAVANAGVLRSAAELVVDDGRLGQVGERRSAAELASSEGEAPASVAEAPASVAEAPASVAEAPASVAEAPADAAEAPASAGEAPSRKAAVLVEALPYIRRFAGKVVVVKYGGNALAGTSEHDALALFAEDIVLMRLVGMQPVVVHGGGPQISDLMARLGKQSEFVNGLRVTDAETVDIARMVLIGLVNPQIVSAINVHGNFAVGVSGEDAGLIKAIQRDPALGFVGDVVQVNPGVLDSLLAEEFIPVIATVGTDATGQAYNINADTVAGAIAEALGAEKLVYLTDIEGLRRDVADPDSLIRQITADELDDLVADGTIAGGMIPKVASCIHAVRHGVHNAHILDGRIAHVLLLEIFTDRGIGTMVLGARPETGPT
jgi:acetylglutamate kinase